MRYILIDYMHLAYKTIVAEPLSTTATINGEVEVIDTTIPNYTIKNIFHYGGRGLFYTGVFFEGGSSFRKDYFKGKGRDGGGYKGQRMKQRGSFYEGINLAIQMLHTGKVSLYRAQGYEADDLIYAMVNKIKETDRETPIDIITNDSDLLPLVDDQVSVYIRGTRQYAEEGCPEHRLYYQVTPRTWDEYLSYTSAFKGYKIPYNSMLLFKLIKGDTSDNIPSGVDGLGKISYTELMEEMEKGVYIKSCAKEIIGYHFNNRKEEIKKDLETVVEKYKPEIKEKEYERFKDTLLQMLVDTDSVGKRDSNWVVRRADVTEDIVKYNNKIRDLTKWGNIRELIKDIETYIKNKEKENTENNEGIVPEKTKTIDVSEEEKKEVIVNEFKRVLTTYFKEEQIHEMEEQGLDTEDFFTIGVDFSNIFRYGNDFDEVMRPVLEHWFTEEEVESLKFVYGGLGLREADIIDTPKQIEPGYLQQALMPLKIKIIK